MNNNITVYKNEMNLVPLRNFTSAEIDLFFAICTKLKDEGTRKVRYDFSELKSISDYYSRSLDRFVQDLEKVYDKMLRLTYTKRNSKSITKFVLFTTYHINIEEQYLDISINKDLEYILNNLTGNFTKFELKELTALKSTYSKNMFRLLKQFRSTGYFKINIEDFRERLDVPNSYRMSDIDKHVLKYIKDDLKNIFKNLTVNKIKGKGRKITHLEFIFDSQSKENDIPAKRNSKKNNIKSIEMTPEWLGKEYEPPKMTEEEKEELQREREKLIEKLKNNDW